MSKVGRKPVAPAPTRSRILQEIGAAIDRSTLSQAELGRRAGYSQVTISNLRRRKNKYTSVVFLEDVAEALGYEIILRRKSR